MMRWLIPTTILYYIEWEWNCLSCVIFKCKIWFIVCVFTHVDCKQAKLSDLPCLSKPTCIYEEFFNDGYINCPYPDCADEEGCSDMVYIIQLIINLITTKALNVIIGANREEIFSRLESDNWFSVHSNHCLCRFYYLHLAVSEVSHFMLGGIVC